MLALARCSASYLAPGSRHNHTPQFPGLRPTARCRIDWLPGTHCGTKAMGQGSDPSFRPGADESPHQTARRWLVIGAALRLQGQNSRPVTSAYLGFGAAGVERTQPVQRREKLANVVFAYIPRPRGRHILSVRDQNTLAPVRKKRLMTVTQLFLIHRYNASSVHY